MWTLGVLLIALSSTSVALPAEEVAKRDTVPPSPLELPGAANILRDPTKLKYEVTGIIGAYLFWLILTILLLIFVGKRLRKNALTIRPTTTTTMMKTFATTERVVEVPAGGDNAGMKSPFSLKSPKFSSIRSWGKKSHKPNNSVYSTTTLDSTMSHEMHRAQDMDDLTKLYAAVMAHDEERSQGHNSATHSPRSPKSPIEPKTPVSPIGLSPLSPGYPPEFAHLHSINAAAQPMKSPSLNQSLHSPVSPPLTAGSFNPRISHYDPNIPSRSNSRTPKSTPLSFSSDVGSRSGSAMSTKSKPSGILIRGQRISQPIGSADLKDAHLYDETVPLSPRIYNPGPPPPTPGSAKRAQAMVEPIAEYSPHQQQEEIQYQQHPQVQYTPQQTSTSTPDNLVQNLRDKRVPPSLALHHKALDNVSNSAQTARPSSTSSRTLPFRHMYESAASALRSAPPTKTTFVDGPTKASGPRTGVVPQTPATPYEPSTPMTPITPRRMLGKAELKAKRKEERLKVLNEDDLVENEDEIWGN